VAKKKKISGSKKKEAKKKEMKKPAPKKSAEKKVIPAKKEVKKKEKVKAALKKTEPKKTEIKKAKQVKNKPVQAGAQKNTASKPMSTDTGKKRLMISYEKLPSEVIEVIRTKYPYGYNHDLREVKGIDNKKFFVLPIELPEVVYLVKVDLRKPIKFETAEEEEDIFTPEEGFAGEEDGFPAEDLEQMEAEDDGGGDDDGKKKRKNDDDDDEV